MPGGEIALIALAAGVGAALTSVAGLGGGTLTLAVMLRYVDPLDAVALHGVIQLVSNSSRTAALRAHVRWQIAGRFTALLLPAGVAGLYFAQWLPADPARLAIVVFALTAAWLPHVAGFVTGAMGGSRAALFVTGALAGFAQMTIGVVGPAIAPLFRHHVREPVGAVATFSAAQTCAHGVKVLLFVVTGFAYNLNVSLLVWAAAAVVAGTVVGTSVLRVVSEQIWDVTFKLALTAVALNVAYGVLAGS